MTTQQTRTYNSLQPGPYQAQQTENAKRKYVIEWISEIGANDISTSAWSVVTGTATLSTEANSTTQTSVIITANVGFARIVNKVTFADGQIDERVIKLTVKDNENTIPNDYGMV